MIICWLTNKQTKLFIWWSSLISLSDKKETNKQKTNKAYHLVIIFWSLDDHLLSENKQTNKQTKLIICWLSVIICWSFDDYLLIIWQQTNKQTNKQTKFIICWLMIICDHLLIILWLSIDNMTTNKQTKFIL